MYSRTSKENGRLNSRCLYCFIAVGTDVDSTTELEHIEARHICPEKVLAHMLNYGRTFELQP